MLDPIVSASTGVMNSLLSKLTTLLGDEYKHLKNVRKEVRFMKDELSSMNALLQKLADMEELDVQAREWRDKVRELAYDFEDCIDIFIHNLDGEDEKSSLIRKTLRNIKKLRLRHHLADKIHELKARVVEESERRDRYKVRESITNSRVVQIDYRLPALFTEAEKLVGIDGPRDHIIQWLMEDRDSGSAQLTKYVSIVGFGGLGKTTLALQVFNLIKDKFDCTAFVSVSRSPDIPKILKDILSGVGYDSMRKLEDQKKLISTLRDYLADKRYLIVIDDIWSINAWETLKCALAQNKNGSRVITTTRIQEVATACCFPCHDHVYQMQPLNELHSRTLFFKRIFDTEDGCPNHFKEISEDLLKKCNGMPLAITSIASLLANQRMHFETWEKIRDSLGSELDTNPTMEWMRHVLSLSYNDLSHELKTCLLYLATYPEDSSISKRYLVRKWIAEGFIREKHGLDLEEVAENYFNELINRSMIEPSLYDTSDEVLSCRVHDLMLDLIISKCAEENFITIVDRQFNINRQSQVRRISHQFNNRNLALAVERTSVSQVRSYNSFPAADCMPLLSKFKLLRVLDLDRGMGRESKSMILDLSAINHLFLLRYLKVIGFLLELPKKFGKLKHLMTLDLSQGWLSPSSNKSSDFTSLSSLRHLILPTQVVLRNGLSKLCNLRSLQGFDIRTNSVECIRDLGELTNLRELTLFYSTLGDVEDNLATILAASLDKLGNSNLCSLYGVGDLAGAKATPTQFWSNCFTRPRHLQRFYFDGLVPEVPNWMGHADRLVYLRKLEVQELRSVEVQILAQLPCLVYLLIARTIPEQGIIFHPNTVLSLKRFEIFCDLSCLTFEPATMPRLQKLEITFYGPGPGAVRPQDGSFPVAGIEHLASLENIYVSLSVKCGLGSKLESECRQAITRHPKSHAIEIRVYCIDYDEDGNAVNSGRQSQEPEDRD